ncbi:MAG: sigma 54-interacting transcriptional regulator, partial [Myxococcota bacterium]
ESGDRTDAGRARLLVYVEGREQTVTRLIELPDGAPVAFGRSRASTVYIDSERVSRNHARVVRSGDEIVVEDLDSRNGTRVNGAKIAKPTVLNAGDELEIGPAIAVLSQTSLPTQTTRIGATWHLDDRLAAETDRGLRYRRPYALLMIRVAGDDRAVDGAIARLVAALRPMDILAEYGPDEYAVLMPELDLTTGVEAAQQQLDEMHRDRRGAAPPVTIRSGMAAFPDHGSQAGTILSQARDALRAARAQDERGVVTPPSQPAPTAEIIVVDPQMKRLYAMVRKVANAPMTVLICGETGAGKEAVAEAVHRESQRREGPFVRVNCACIADTLLESELFGYERGAFTGADRRKEGYFEAAAGGTLFLDEIGEISAALQAKLLRVLEQRVITRIGGTREVAIDTRVVCATNRDLQAEVERGTFRQDLYFRISPFVLMLPPLRDRPSEIPLLADHFIAQSARALGASTPTLSEAARARLLDYSWPGNVRELRNAMERAVVLQTEGVIDIGQLPERIKSAASSAARVEPVPGGVGDVREHVADVERQQIVAALEACGGNQTMAARKLGLSRRALIYRLEKYGLKPLPASRR